MNSSIFKAYDIRGIYPSELDEETAYYLAHAYALKFRPKTVVIGRDVRLSGLSLVGALKKGFMEAGVDMVDIGVITTDMLYFAVAHYGYDGGITVSASHNPKEYNGFKLVKKGSEAISSDSGLFQLKEFVLAKQKKISNQLGKLEEKNIVLDYVQFILSFVDPGKIDKKKVVANSNFGFASHVVDGLAKYIPLELTRINWELDGNFPKGRPDPLIPGSRVEIMETVKKEKTDFGVAWDADADRCFFFDEKGNFIDGYFITALLAEYFLKRHPGEKIIGDPRLVWATHDVVINNGGMHIINKVGHTFIKERMRAENAIFAGEMSGHYYFRDYFYADNGMIPFLIILQMLSETGKIMSKLLEPFTSKYFVSGEINFEIKNKEALLREAEKKYQDSSIEHVDGLSVEYADWRFNFRSSNTENLVRLNLEARSLEILQQKTDELTQFIREFTHIT